MRRLRFLLVLQLLSEKKIIDFLPDSDTFVDSPICGTTYASLARKKINTSRT